MKPTKRKPAPDVLSPEDAEFMARMRAMPQPNWMRSMLAYKTHAERMREFYRELDRANAEMSPADAALYAHLSALPRPNWMSSVERYQSHADRMRAWYCELDKHQRPVTWRPISAERAEYLARYCYDCRGPCSQRKPCDLMWTDKRREQVKAIAAARGDIIPTSAQEDAA